MIRDHGADIRASHTRALGVRLKTGSRYIGRSRDIAMGSVVMEGRRLVATEVLTKPPAHQPNGKVEYSNFNYIIAGAILEKITRKCCIYIH